MNRWIRPLCVCVALALSCSDQTEVAMEDLVTTESNGFLKLSDARLVAIPASDLTIAVWENQLGTNRDDSAYSVKRGGRDFSTARRTQFEIAFRGDRFDPKAYAMRQAEASLYIVQFYAPPLPEFFRGIEQQGATILRSFPRNAVIAAIDSAVIDDIRNMSMVRAVIPFEAERRIERAAGDDRKPRRYFILPSSQEPNVKGFLAAQLAAWGAVVHPETVSHYLLEATITNEQLTKVASLAEVLHVDPWSAPESDMDKVRVISGANVIEDALGFTGQGVRGEVMDGNVEDQHPDLVNKNILFHGSNSGEASHGTSTTGIIFGEGRGNAQARGLLPSGQPIFADYDNFFDQGDRRAHTSELNQAPYHAVFQSNSWGNELTTQYTNISAEMDSIVFDLDFLIFNSQSNAGNQQSRPQAWSKNVVSIGGVHHYDTLDTADDKWASGGSIGPASDGRIKPELAHFWDETLAPTTGGGYDQFGGTSGATPITAGYAGLLLQMWSAGLFGNSTAGSTVFENRPHFTTTKALLVNTATQWTFSGIQHDLTRSHQGWGRVDLKRIYDLRNQMLIIDESEILTQGQSKTYEVEVATGAPELRATMTWADPPAVPSAGIHRVNDLTLKVTSPGGTIYFGNNGLNQNMYSAAGGQANTIDTLENVIIQYPEVGIWKVEVRADEVAQDGHIESAAVDADFALVVSGINRTSQNAPPTVAITSPSAASEIQNIVVITAEAADTDGSVLKVRFQLPDGTYVDDYSAPYSAEFDTILVNNGPAQLIAVATDNMGATSTAAIVNVTVQNAENILPSATIIDPGAPISGTFVFEANANDTDGRITRVAFTLPDGSTVNDAAAPYVAEFDTTSVLNGTYTVTAVATDNRGGSSAPSNVEINVSNAVSACADGTLVASGLPIVIPDNDPTGIQSSILVRGAGQLTGVRISMQVKHTYRGDLIVSLKNPAGQTVILSNREGSGNDDIVMTNQQVAGFSGRASGAWTLSVVDRAMTDKGTLDQFSLHLTTNCGAAP